MQCGICGQQGGDQSVRPNESRIRRGVPCRDRVSPYREHCGSGASNLQRASPGTDELCARSGADADRTALQFTEVSERPRVRVRSTGACPLPNRYVVWVNTRSRVYHFEGTHNYGHTKEGAYMCEADAKAAGDRAAMNEHHP
jgi:hypothetical protein